MGLQTELSTGKVVAIALGIAVVSAGIGAAVTIVTLGVSPVAPGAGTLAGSDVLSIDSQELQYTGTNVTGADIVVNNTDTDPHSVDVHVALRNTTSGTVVRSTTVTSVNVPAGGTTNATVSFTDSVSVGEFDKVEVTVEQTG